MGSNDFVVLLETYDGIVARSVGHVKCVHENGKMNVFFLGVQREIEIPAALVEWFDVAKTGKPKTGPQYQLKICNNCFLLKDRPTEFERNQNDGKGRPTYRPSCRECRVGITGKSMTTPEKRRMDRVRPPTYSIYTCPICQQIMIVGVTASIVADHSHTTGKGREWICDRCNTGLGRFKDDPMFIQRTLDYFKKHE